MNCKKYKGYLILGILAIIFSLAYIASKFISPGSNSLPGIYEFLFILFITPCFSIIYGALSYILTKQTVIPNFIFAISFNIFLVVPTLTSDFLKEIVQSLPFGIIIFIISTVSSFISKLIAYCFAKHKKSKDC